MDRIAVARELVQVAKNLVGKDDYTGALAEAYGVMIGKFPALRKDKEFQKLWGELLDWATFKDKVLDTLRG
jgi:gamma-glutamylcyclotransferase (GGCT)/AIG2-like uncharacterized protein YtfP